MSLNHKHYCRMKNLNIRDCLEILLKADHYLQNGLITVEEFWMMTKEADDALCEAKKELFAMMQTGKKWKLPFFEADLSDLTNS